MKLELVAITLAVFTAALTGCEGMTGTATLNPDGTVSVSGGYRPQIIAIQPDK